MKRTLVALALFSFLAPAYGKKLLVSHHHPGDRNIQDHPSVVWAEDFEIDDLGALRTNWKGKNEGNMTITNTPFQGNEANRAIFIRGEKGGGINYHNYPGYEHLYRRFYIRYTKEGQKPSHGCSMYGDYPPPQWAIGRAGHRPEGDNRWSASIEPIGAMTWGNYGYWCRMHPFPNGRYWGNVVMPVPKKEIPREQWICVEQMVMMNDPVTERNGEQAVWIDGEKILHQGKGFPDGRWEWGKFVIDPEGEPFEGFQWRTDEKLKITTLGFGSWTPHDGTLGTWFDHIVIATERIGPLAR